MKKIRLALILVSILVTLAGNELYPAVFHSTPDGGHWDTNETWIEYGHPGTNDTAYVQSQVIVGYVNGYNYYDSYAGYVVVESNGSLLTGEYGGGSAIFTLFVTWDIINYGTIYNGAEALKISVHGDVYNYGNWSAYETYLVASDNQNIFLEAGKTFGGNWVVANGYEITAMSDITYTGVCGVWGNTIVGDFNLNGATLHMGDHVINTTGTLMYNGKIEGNFEIQGVFSVNKNVSDTLIFIGNITVTDTLKASVYGGGYGIQELLIEGNIINNGWIKDDMDTDNDDDLNILITGNIVNNARWTCNYVNFVGEGHQYISQSPGTFFESNFYDLNAEGNTFATTDITITKDVDLNGAILDMQGHNLTMTTWLKDGYLNNAQLTGGYLSSLTATTGLSVFGKVSSASKKTRIALFINTLRLKTSLNIVAYLNG